MSLLNRVCFIVAMKNTKVNIVVTEPKPLVDEFQHEDVAMIFEKEVRCGQLESIGLHHHSESSFLMVSHNIGEAHLRSIGALVLLVTQDN